MTFSLVTRCTRTGQFGVAACTAMPGVGKIVSHARAKVGAIATQATMNPYHGIDGLMMLAQGMSAEQVLHAILQRDRDLPHRQFGIIDSSGQTAAWTGNQTPGWAGHILVENIAAQGNRLVGRETLEAAIDALINSRGDLARRLVKALAAGERTGADREGARSAAVYVVDTEEYPLWDMRADLAKDPVKTLRKIEPAYRRRLLPQIRRTMPKRSDPSGQLLEPQLGEIHSRRRFSSTQEIKP
ncbi:MAG: DUF1028 domain-containing protein [Phycisphaerales bacterium]